MRRNVDKNATNSRKRFSGFVAFVTDNIVNIIMLAVGLLIICVFLYVGVKNESNKINEGIIVDKSYRAAYSTTTYRSQGDLKLPVTKYHPATYHLVIEGEKDGKTVTYCFAVTEDDYKAYKIGDYYRK